LFIVQALAPELKQPGHRPLYVASASIGGGDFDGQVDLEASHPWRGGLAGLLKTAAKEFPDAWFRAVDFDEVPDATLLLRELTADGPVEVGHRQGKRLRVDIVHQELAGTAAPATDDLTRDSVVLVTGGAQGITAEVACELAERSKATFILLGRSPVPAASEDPSTATINDRAELRRVVFHRLKEKGQSPSPKEVETRVQGLLKAREIRRVLGKLSRAGSRVEYISCDVRNTASLEQVIRDVNHRYGGIDALVHGAGIIEDRALLDKTADSFDRVLRTKVNPLLTLARGLDVSRLKAAFLFTSVAGFFGNPGQADYAAANEILNRMARRLRNLWQRKIVALNWGPWEGTGMVTPELARELASRGMSLVSVAGGRRAAWHEAAYSGSDEVRVVLGPGSWVEEAEHLALALADSSRGAKASKSHTMSVGRSRRRADHPQGTLKTFV
jgi:NAD(P)-dependent dehydrogenase (short-subunit alcohol dehydrogenase family)